MQLAQQDDVIELAPVKTLNSEKHCRKDDQNMAFMFDLINHVSVCGILQPPHSSTQMRGHFSCPRYSKGI